jgi:hypothetical protein
VYVMLKTLELQFGVTKNVNVCVCVLCMRVCMCMYGYVYANMCPSVHTETIRLCRCRACKYVYM